MWIENVDSSIVRILFIIIFSALFVWLAFILGQLYTTIIKHRLLHRREIPLLDSLGWLRGTCVCEAPIKLKSLFRRPPGGIWYWIMVLVFLTAYTSHLLTSTIQRQVNTRTCPFTTGLVLGATDALENPSPNTANFISTHNSQIYSYYNGCPNGIFSKVKTVNGTSFCVRGKDILGYWTCSANSETPSKSYDANMVDSKISADAISNGLLYSQWEAFRWTTVTGQPYHYVAWSTSVAHNAINVANWTVKAAIEAQTPSNGSPRIIDFYSCQVVHSTLTDPTGIITKISTSLNSTGVIMNWAPILETYAYSGLTSLASNANMTIQIAQLLNDIYMVSGSGDNPSNKPTLTTDNVQGCKELDTWLPWYVLGFVFAVALLDVLLTFWLLISLCYLKFRHNSNFAEKMPYDLWSWAAFAAGMSRGADVAVPELRDWLVCMKDDGGVYLQRRHGVPEAVPLTNYMSPR